MSDQMTREQRRVTVWRSVALLSLIFSFSLILLPASAFAQEAPAEENTQQSTVLTASCSTVAPAWQPEEKEPLEEVIAPPITGPSGWSALGVTGAARTNTTMTWQWNKPTSSNADATHTNGYALYYGENEVARGELTADVTSYTASAGSDGYYRFFIWIIETTNGEPQPTGCESADTELDTTGPVINGSTYAQSGNKATPQLTTAGTDVTLDWAVNASVDEVTIEASNQLNPTFTFLKDGTYIFTLTAIDSLGNTSTVSMTITYTAPFVSGPEVPVTPLVNPAPIDSFVPPQQVLAQAKKAVLDSHNYGATAFDVTESTDAALNAQTTAPDGDRPAVLAATTAPIDSSSEGWVILGVPWYWWLLGSGGLAAAGLWYRNYFLNNMPIDI